MFLAKKESLENYLRDSSLLSEQLTGIGPASPAWEAGVLPMNYSCAPCFINSHVVL